MVSPAVVVVLVAYGLILLALGVWGSRDSASVAGYFVAGKRLPSWVIAFSSNTTGESAWLLLGLTGMGYAIGVHALWIVMGEVLGVALAWAYVALPFKAFTDRYDSITVPDYLESRFRDEHHLFRLISLVIIVSMVIAYITAQLTATGKAFNSFLGMSYNGGVILGAIIIVVYTSIGGYKAVAYSDLVQGLLMVGGLVVLPIVGIVAAGGWTDMLANLHTQDAKLLAPMGSYGFTLRGVLSALSFIGIGFAFLGAPQLLTRFMAARDRRQIVDGGLIAVLCVITFDVGAVFAGMAGRALVPGLADREAILPQMAADLFPAVFTGIFLVIVLAAIMSTVDSLLILASSSVVRDVMQKIYRPTLSDGRVALYGKITTVVIGAAALLLALGQVRMIFWFVLFAWSGLASAFTPVVLCSLFWKRTTREGAIAGMVAGFLAAVIWVISFKSAFFDLYEMIPGFLVGFGVTVVVSLLTAVPAEVVAEFDEIRKGASDQLPAGG